MQLSEIRTLDQGVEIDASVSKTQISGVSANSQQIAAGELFVAIDGSQRDGAEFAEDAIANGAVAIVGHRGMAGCKYLVPLLIADQPRLILSQLAARFHPGQPEYVVAVTGTAGKTSVASFARQIWAAAGFNAASIGTTGLVAPGRRDYGSLTTPDPVQLHELLSELATAGITHAAMEASSHGLDQFRLDGVKLAAAAFTNIGRDHLDYHLDMESYFKAKMGLFNRLLSKGAPAVMFADDGWSKRAIEAARHAQLDICTVGRAGSFIAIKRVEHEQFRQVAEIVHAGRVYRVAFPLAGDFQIANAMVAAGLAIVTGGDPEAVFGALATLEGAPGRLELVGRSVAGAPVYVDYAHKPEALENVLTSLRPFTTGRLWVVFGCGGDRDPGKRPVMGEIAERLADMVVVTDDNPRTEHPAAIRAAILAASNRALEIADRKQAIAHAITNLGTGDCLVIAGKGHEEGQIVGDKTLRFSDHAVARELIAEQGQ